MEIDYEYVFRRMVELYLARVGSELIGGLTGKQVSSAHRCAIEKCKELRGFEALGCVVDKMREIYENIRVKGYEEGMKESECTKYIVVEKE